MEWDNYYMTETTIYNRDNYIWQWQLFITETTIYNGDNYYMSETTIYGRDNYI